MDALTKKHLDNLHNTDANSRYESFQYLIKETQPPVDWAYEVWDDLLKMLKDGDNHQRSISVQLLSNLAKSDPERRMKTDIDKLIDTTKDEKFVTARHALQSLWKPALVSPEMRELVVTKLADRFKSCKNEKNCTLIRYDITEVLRKIYNSQRNEDVRKISMDLIATETDLKYQKKYMTAWTDLIRSEKKAEAKKDGH
jgi:ribosomal protein L17